MSSKATRGKIESKSLLHGPLLEEYGIAKKRYAEAVAELDRQRAILQTAEYVKLCAVAADARMEAERLRKAVIKAIGSEPI